MGETADSTINVRRKSSSCCICCVYSWAHRETVPLKLSWMSPDLVDLLSPLETAICTRLLPSLTDQRAPGPMDSESFALPASLVEGGLVL